MSYHCSIYAISAPDAKVQSLPSVDKMITEPGYYERVFLRRPKAKGTRLGGKRQSKANLVDINF